MPKAYWNATKRRYQELEEIYRKVGIPVSVIIQRDNNEYIFRDILGPDEDERVSLCHGCDICAKECPIVSKMEFSPDQLFRLMQIEDYDRVLSSNTIWYCTACYTCSVHCPKGINVAKVMNHLRMIALEEGYPSPLPQVIDFHKLFLHCIQRSGRLNGIELMIRYNLRRKRPFRGFLLALMLLLKSRLKVAPHYKVKELREIFQRAERLKGEECNLASSQAVL